MADASWELPPCGHLECADHPETCPDRQAEVQLQEFFAGCWMWRRTGPRSELEPELARRLEEYPDRKYRLKERPHAETMARGQTPGA